MERVRPEAAGLVTTAARALRWPVLLFALGLIMGGCKTAAELIPGDESQAIAIPRPTPAPVLAPPILPPTRLQLGGDRTTANKLAVTDAELALSVVRIEAKQGSNMVRAGTGVVVDGPQRLILTSYQVVEPFAADGTRAWSALEIATTRNVGEAPQAAYLGQVVRADPELGLAVVRAMRRLDGAPLNATEFDLPSVTLGGAARAARGDTIRILGYAGIEGGRSEASSLVATEAAVLGFRGGVGVAGVAWLKTQARVPSGQNGAPVFDPQGRLLGTMLQVAYSPVAPAGQVRPVTLATRLIDDARQAGPEAVYAAPMFRRGAFATGPVVTRPAFAENQLENGNGDLFDYTETYPDSLTTLNYEFVLQGAAPGTLVEERWFLNGVMQDGLSSSVPWAGGAFEVVTDRLKAPAGRVLQAGTWRLEVWAGREMRTAAEAHIGSAQRRQPAATEFRFGSTSNIDGTPRDPARPTMPQILATFQYEQAGGAHRLRWIVLHDAQVAYQSPSVPWEGGESGTWWVGYSPGTNIGSGTWEFEVYLDDQVIGTDGLRF
ncbi:MAG: serine protease [Dehalococcoidia bacterium]|nr:serine protease [Dehalococcoidia bacterium]